jgi:acyl-CoA thioester hydrolase
MALEVPFRRYRKTIGPDWVDYNGHMNMACYVMAFDWATDVLFEALGLGEAYMRARDRSIFAVEAMVGYERELVEGMEIVISTRIIAADAIRLHLFHEMFHVGEGWRAARMESMALHIDMTTRKTTRFDEEMAASIAAVAKSHDALPPAEGVGRHIGQRR